MIFSNTAMIVERAAKDIKTKKQVPHILPPLIWLKIFGNVITNARKYAKTNIDVSITLDGGYVSIHFRDYGSGIPDEDIPFIFGKFYRGKNCGSEQGSGLGLYIVKYVAEQSLGTAKLRNCEKGLEVTISLPVKTS